MLHAMLVWKMRECMEIGPWMSLCQHRGITVVDQIGICRGCFIFAESDDEPVYVLQTMCAKLGKVDVQTKVFTTQDVNIPDVVIVNDEPSDVMKSTI